jgi:hypothetical protein
MTVKHCEWYHLNGITFDYPLADGGMLSPDLNEVCEPSPSLRKRQHLNSSSAILLLRLRQTIHRLCLLTKDHLQVP